MCSATLKKKIPEAFNFGEQRSSAHTLKLYGNQTQRESHVERTLVILSIYWEFLVRYGDITS